MFSSYLIPLSSLDTDTVAVETVVGIAMAALVVLIIVIVAVVAVAGFARWWKKEDSGTFNLKTDVSMECSITPYCVFVCIWHKILLKLVYDDVVMY